MSRIVDSPQEQIVESPPQLIVESKSLKHSFAQEKKRGLLKELKHLEPENNQVDEAPPASRTRSRTRQSSSASNMARALCAAAVVTGGTLAPQVVAARQYPMQVIAEMANAVLDKETGDMLEYRQLLKNPKYRPDWTVSSANEFGRLCNGIGGRIKNPTNTMFFVNKTDVPQERFKDVTYGKFVCVVRPQKAEPNRTRLTLGGNLVNYPGEVGTPTADMLLIKIMLNSVLSTPGAKFMGIDISNFYLNTPLPRYEYLKLKLTDIPQEVIDEYKLMEKVTPDGYVYVEIRKGMYGLPQAGLIAQELLEKRLNEAGYF